MTCKWKRGWRECEGQAQRSLSETSSSCICTFLRSAIVSWSRVRFPTLLTIHPWVDCSQSKDDCEKKKAAHQESNAQFAHRQPDSMFFRGRNYDWLRIKFRRSRDVWGSAETEAEADSDWHLVPEGTPHPCFSSFKVSLQTYNVWITQKKSNK